MSSRTPIVVECSRADLEALHALIAPALSYDEVSPSLLAEKLFENPWPDRDRYATLAMRDGDRIVGALQTVTRRCEQRGWLGLFAVEADRRRQGVARTLFEQAESRWRAAGVRTVEVLTIPSNYLTPGIDPRYTPALCFVEAMGFEQTTRTSNMRAILDGDFDTTAEEARLAASGIEVRRVRIDDEDRIAAFFGEYFGEGWLREVQLSMRCDPPAVHVALRDDRIIAFSAHSSMNVEWGNFGPMGTADAARGKGIGHVLLYRCMADLKAAGHATAVIPWIGPYRFYSQLLDCRIERVFWRYRKTLDDAAT